MDLRQHHRAQLRLPVRLRWSAPFGQKIELATSINASRAGLLVSSDERHSPGVLIWVTFPYDRSLSDGQPEIAARVVRCDEVLEVLRATNAREKVEMERASELERMAKLDQLVRVLGIADVPATFALALQFEKHAQAVSNGNGQQKKIERRTSSRRGLAVPVRVRPEGMPWFEEAMTIDFSDKGLRFRSCREYQPGDQLKVAFENQAAAPWPSASEISARVLRVVPAGKGFALDVAVCRES
jgi:PilZ domain